MAKDRLSAATEHLGVKIGADGASARRQRERDASAAAVHRALNGTAVLTMPSAEREQLWLVLREQVCTRGYVWAQPMGSRWQGQVGGEDARQTELVAAISWLTENEAEARQLDPNQLMRTLRGVAVRGRRGSGRAAQADALHGMTGVTEGAQLTFVDEWVA